MMTTVMWRFTLMTMLQRTSCTPDARVRQCTHHIQTSRLLGTSSNAPATPPFQPVSKRGGRKPPTVSIIQSVDGSPAEQHFGLRREEPEILATDSPFPASTAEAILLGSFHDYVTKVRNPLYWSRVE